MSNTGMIFKGVLIGTRVQQPRGQNQQPKTFIGITVTTIDQYNNPQDVTTDIQVPAAAVQQVLAHVQQLKDKVVEVPIFISPWAGNRGASYTIMLDTQRVITEVGKQQPLAKVS